MKSLMLVVCTVAVLVMPPGAAVQDSGHGDSPKVTISIGSLTQIGATMLKPGDYRFQCKHVDGKTVLVITVVGTGKEILRVPCEEEAIGQKIGHSELRSIIRPDGVRILQSVRIKGETIGHRLVAD
jgi:hypothetical protein